MDKNIKNMDKNPTISIGISFYNAAPFFRDAIQSVLNQTLTDYELILLDDGSTDDSLQIARSYDDPRIRVVSDGENHGLAARLNELVRLSRGDYFVRMDADDIMHPERLERQIRYLRQHPDTDVLGCDVFSIDTANHITGTIRYSRQPNSIADVYNHYCFIHPTVIARRQWFADNPYDETALRMEDYNLWLRTIERYRFVNMDDELLYYRVSGLPYLRKYLQSKKGERRELRKLKSRIPGYWKVMLKNYLTCVAYTIFTTFHLTDILLKRRSAGIDDDALRNRAKEGLQRAIKREEHHD